ncbi:MAG: metal-dependent hydrolase [Blastocatellia bacterium]
MDNVTHTLVGAALAQTGLKRWTPLATTALLLGANFPDIDILVGFNTLTYLEHHRGITHAIVAIPLLSLLLAGGLYAGARRWRSPDQTRARFGPLLVLSMLAMWTHPLLDFTNSYGWRPFLPWSHEWYYGDIAFVVDPWLWASLGGTLMLVTATAARVKAWGALFAVLAIPVLFFGNTFWGLKVGWVLLVGLLFLLRASLTLAPPNSERLMCAMLMLVLFYFGGLIWLQRAVWARTQLAAPEVIQAGEQIVKTDALPIPANPFRWRTVISTDRAFYFRDLSLLSATAPELRRYERTSGEAAAIMAALREPELQTFLRFARYPAITARRRADQNTEVEIRDVRFYDLDATTNSTFRLALQFDAQMRRLVE